MKNYLMGTVFGALIVGLCVSVGLNLFLLSIVDEHVVLRAAPKDTGATEPAPNVPVSIGYTASVYPPPPVSVEGVDLNVATQTGFTGYPPSVETVAAAPMPFNPTPSTYYPPAPCQNAVPCPVAAGPAAPCANAQATPPCQATLTFSINELGPQATTVALPFAQMPTAPACPNVACATERCNQVFVLRNTAATDVANALNTFMTTSPLFCANAQQANFSLGADRQFVIVAEPTTNKLLVSATPKGFKEVERLICELDASTQAAPAAPSFAATLLKGCSAGNCVATGACPAGACATGSCPNTGACANSAATASTGTCPAIGCAQAATAFGLITGATFVPVAGCQAATAANVANICPVSAKTKTSEAELAEKLEKCMKRLAELEKKMSETQQPVVPYFN